jgi:hypothetical protein
MIRDQPVRTRYAPQPKHLASYLALFYGQTEAGVSSFISLRHHRHRGRGIAPDPARKGDQLLPPRLGGEPASRVAKNVFTAWAIAADALPRHFSEVISLRSSLFDM